MAKRYGMMLSALDEKLLGRFRYIFYRRSGVSNRDVMIYRFGSVLTYIKRGWSFDQQLGGGFKMLVQRHCVVPIDSEWEKYDYVVYFDIEVDKPPSMDERKRKVHETRQFIAEEVTREIEEYLFAHDLSVEIEAADPNLLQSA